MSQQKRHGGVRPDTRDVKSRCEEDRHTRDADTHTEPTAEGTGQKQKLNVWRSLMSLRFLSTTAGTGAQENQCVCGRECVCV